MVYDEESGLVLSNTSTTVGTMNGQPYNNSSETNYTIELLNTQDDIKTYKYYSETSSIYSVYEIQNGVILGYKQYVINEDVLYVTIVYTFPDNAIIRAKVPSFTISSITYEAIPANSSYQFCEIASDSDSELTIRVKTYNTATGVLTGQYEFTYIRHGDEVADVNVSNIEFQIPSVKSGDNITLQGVVKPENATNKTIVWSVESGDATINGSNITFNAAGEVKIKATITNGLGQGSDYTKVFTIPVQSPTSISGKKTATIKTNFAGITNGQINLNLKAGTYTAQLYNSQGRLVKSVDITATNGINTTGIRTDNLSKGIFILNVKQTGVSVLKQKITVK
jgi:hypothetical protein